LEDLFLTVERPLIGISAGDPAGVGPEIAVKALSGASLYETCRPLVIADLRVMIEAVRIAGVSVRISRLSSPEEGLYRPGTIDVLDLDNVDMDSLRYGEVSAMAGKASFEYVQKAIELALAGKIDATVTGPIHKEAINAAGFHYAGHTEIYGDLTGTKDYTMMLADEGFRVVHVSTHVSLREAIDRVKKERILRVIQLAQEGLLSLGISNPRIAVAGLNPHCGEGGLFGSEDDEEIRPAVEEARAGGIDAEGPIPGDTVFSKMKGGQYDLVVAMYHDQGHIPMKLSGVQYDETTKTWLSMSGVNITLGLPIIRSSVDHGVAFDRAGQGTANPQSMIQAIEMAVELARARREARALS